MMTVPVGGRAGQGRYAPGRRIALRRGEVVVDPGQDGELAVAAVADCLHQRWPREVRAAGQRPCLAGGGPPLGDFAVPVALVVDARAVLLLGPPGDPGDAAAARVGQRLQAGPSTTVSGCTNAVQCAGPQPVEQVGDGVEPAVVKRCVEDEVLDRLRRARAAGRRSARRASAAAAAPAGLREAGRARRRRVSVRGVLGRSARPGSPRGRAGTLRRRRGCRDRRRRRHAGRSRSRRWRASPPSSDCLSRSPHALHRRRR